VLSNEKVVVADPSVIAGLDNYRNLVAAQQPTWPDQKKLEEVKAILATYPPLVFAGEVDILKSRLAQAASGKAFLLQGGDCAETFADATADRIRNRVKTMLQMAVVLTYGASMPVVKMGRMAGQFAKPRTSDTETREGLELPAYRGDAVNGYDFTLESRTADPMRLLQAYNTSASTLNLIRAYSQWVALQIFVQFMNGTRVSLITQQTLVTKLWLVKLIKQLSSWQHAEQTLMN